MPTPPFYSSPGRSVREKGAAPAPPSWNRIRRVVALAGALLLAFPGTPSAHEIPARVTILAFVKPEGHRLRLVVRVPLEAMRDLQYPLQGAGYLDIAAIDSLLPDAARTWIANSVDVYEEATKLGKAAIIAAHVSLPSDRSFTEYASAVTHVSGAGLPANTELAWQQAMMDVLFEYDIASDQSRFSINPALARLGVRTTTILRFLPPGGAERAFEYTGDPGLVRLDPRWHQALLRFIELGFAHIMDGIDHLLFILCLVIPSVCCSAFDLQGPLVLARLVPCSMFEVPPLTYSLTHLLTPIQ